ncbi:MAG: hypothetical protein WKG32_06255 [Gemmatimonadaceae bacterium]
MSLHQIIRRAAAAGTLAAVALAAAGCSPDVTSPVATPALKKGGGLPERYVIPGSAVYPEGIAYEGRSRSIFVSSTTDGTIYRGEIDDEVLVTFLPGGQDGRTTAIGIEVDDRGHLFVAGGATGKVFAYDTRTGALINAMGNSRPNAFLNDIAVTTDGLAYVTDSRNPVIYQARRNRAGRYELDPWLDLTGTAIQYQPGINLNGIDATRNGKYLFTVQSNTGQVFRIDTRTKEVVEVDLAGTRLTNGDGLFVRGNTLYITQNAQEILSEIRLRPNRTKGEIVSQTTDPSFMYPTSIVGVRGRLMVVNSQFDRRNAGLPPVLPFTVSVIATP